MRFTWDQRKRKANLRDHGFDFADARRVFEGPTATYEDDRFAYGEQRFVTLGLLNGRRFDRAPGIPRTHSRDLVSAGDPT